MRYCLLIAPAAAFLFLALFAHADSLPLPNREGMTNWGCTVTASSAAGESWKVQVWAEHSDNLTGAPIRDWQRWLAQRSSLKKGLSDCAQFMTAMAKLRKKK